jgi:hypothetical protein
MTFNQTVILAVPGFLIGGAAALLGWRFVLMRRLRRSDALAGGGKSSRVMRLLGQSFETSASSRDFGREARYACNVVLLICKVVGFPICLGLMLLVLGMMPETGLQQPSLETLRLASLAFVTWGGAYIAVSVIELAIGTHDVRLSAREG